MIFIILFILLLLHAFFKQIYNYKFKKNKKEPIVLYITIIFLDVIMLLITFIFVSNMFFSQKIDVSSINNFNNNLYHLERSNTENKKIIASVDYLTYKYLIDKNYISYYYIFGFTEDINKSILVFFRGKSTDEIIEQAKREALIDNFKYFDTSNVNNFIYSYYSMLVLNKNEYQLEPAFKKMKINNIKYKLSNSKKTPEEYFEKVIQIVNDNLNVFYGRDFEYLGNISNNYSDIIFEIK